VGSVLGTAAYLAPEQARGEEAGPRADIYSLGVVAYQLLSGRLPYEASSLSELALKQQREMPARLHELDPDVPRELSSAVAMALALDQEERPTNALAFADALRKGLHGIDPLGPEAKTTALGSTRATTRILPQQDDPTAATRVAGTAVPRPQARGQRRLRTGDAGPAPARAAQERRRSATADMAPAPERRGRAGRAVRRLVAILLLMAVFLAAVIVAVVIATSTSSSVVHLRTVVGNDVHSVVQQIQHLIGSNTK
jgi:serine/threonine-protein kinase